MEEYIWRRQNTITQFIATQSLLDLCEETQSTPGARVGMPWWEQAGLDLEGATYMTALVEEAEGTEKRRKKKEEDSWDATLVENTT